MARRIKCVKCKTEGQFSIHGKCSGCGYSAPYRYNLSPINSENVGNRRRARLSREAGNDGGGARKGY
jgi:hypothetical protein